MRVVRSVGESCGVSVVRVVGSVWVRVVGSVGVGCGVSR